MNMKSKISVTFSILTLLLFFLFLSPAQSAETNTVHFWIEFDSDPNHIDEYAADTYVNEVKTIAEDVWSYLITNLGYHKPPNALDNPASNDNRVKIKLIGRNPPISGATTSDADLKNTPPTITLDNNYGPSDYNNGYTWGNITGVDRLKDVLIHEFFHAIQQAYSKENAYISTLMDWFWDGTAAWIEDEWSTTDNQNTYIADSYAKSYLQNTKYSITSETHTYSVVLFWKYLTEQGYSIKTILENYETGGYTTANNTDMLKAIGQALGDPSPDYFGANFKTLFKDFSLACYMKTGTYGFQDDGASQLPDVTKASPDNIDDWYIDSYDTATGNITTKDANLPHLATSYIPILKPSTLSESVPLHLGFYGNTDGWGVWAVKLTHVGDTWRAPV